MVWIDLGFSFGEIIWLENILSTSSNYIKHQKKKKYISYTLTQGSYAVW